MTRQTILLFFSISILGIQLREEIALAEGACSVDERALFDDDDFSKCWVDSTSVFGLNTQRMSEAYPILSDACLGCVIEMTHCGMQHCKRKCAPWPIGHGASSEKCKACSRDLCGEAFDHCTGKTPISDDQSVDD